MAVVRCSKIDSGVRLQSTRKMEEFIRLFKTKRQKGHIQRMGVSIISLLSTKL